MSGSKKKMRRSRRKGVASRKRRGERTELDTRLGVKNKYFEIFVTAIFLAFGIYHSILYFGHKIVPAPDFGGFVSIGHELLSFQLPSNYMRAPVVGLLQAGLSSVVRGQHPDLTAGWLLNAILHPFNLLLFWQVGKRIVGKSAVWFAVIAILNPWVLYMLTEPIAETTLLFFTLLTFYFIFKRSKLCYFFASITAMVRYEGAALILAAFVMDTIYCSSKRERIRAFLYSAIATVPLGLWMLGTILSRESGTGHYFDVFFSKEYSKTFPEPVSSRIGLVMHMKLLWDVGFQPLLVPFAGAGRDFGEMLLRLSKVFAVVGFFFGSIYGLCKRQWRILALLIFFVPYFTLHVVYPYPFRRFHTNIFWIALLICWCGWLSGWKLVDRNGRVPRALILVFQASSAIVAFVWLASLVPHLSKESSRSPTSASVPYAAMVLVALIFAARLFIYKSRYFFRELSILALMCLIIVSNQFSLVRTVGDGQKYMEFKLLADWYVANARPGEKLAVYMAGVVGIYVPEHADNIVRPPKADTPSEFIEACYEKDITYVVWATREGRRRDPTLYRQLGLHKTIDLLRTPKDVGPYQFIAQKGIRREYVNVFRLRRPTDGLKKELPGT
jgi:hypothetical protein